MTPDWRWLDVPWVAMVTYVLAKTVYEQARGRRNGHGGGRTLEPEVPSVVRERFHDLADQLHAQVTSHAVLKTRMDGMAEALARIEAAVDKLGDKVDRVAARQL